MFATEKNRPTSHFARNQQSGASRAQDNSLWAPLVDNIGNPETARLIVDLFEQHPSLKQQNPAVFLRAQHTLTQQVKVQAKPAAVSTGYTLGKAAASLFNGLLSIVAATGQGLSVVAQLLMQWVQDKKVQIEARRNASDKSSSAIPAVVVSATGAVAQEEVVSAWPEIHPALSTDDAQAVRH